MSTRRALVFSRNPHRWDLPILAWEGDDAGHVGVQIDNEVIDATMRHGVAPWDVDAWMTQRELVQRILVTPASDQHAAIADKKLRERIGCGYDFAGILGFPLLRDLDDRRRYWCSELAALWWQDATGITLPGRTGRRGVRLLRWAADSREQSLAQLAPHHEFSRI